MRFLALPLAGTLALGAALAPRDAPGVPAARPALLPAWAGSQPRFGWSGAWLFPVGDGREIGKPGPGGSPAYRINRCIGGPEEGVNRHEGVDLSCGRGGDIVRAAAHGLVVRAQASGWNGGYGRHIVIAHRLVEGGLVYSVYAHLADQSLRVRSGQLVAAGQPIARVGRSGRASSEHLHFEVRLPPGRDDPWQRAEVLDPVTFVEERLPTGRGDTSANAPYLEWAECAALVESSDLGDSTLDRGAWWRMLAHSAKTAPDEVPQEPDSLRQALVGADLLAAGEPPPAAQALSWKEMARDLRRLAKAGVMVPRPPISPATHRTGNERRFGVPRPSRALDALGERKAAPRVGEACVVLADLSGSWEPPKKKVQKAAPADSTRPTPKPASGVQAGREVDAVTR